MGFSKIWALGTNQVLDIFDSEVEITEKIDGSYFSFYKEKGEVVRKSKRQILYGVQGNKMFSSAIEQVDRISLLIEEGYSFHGEYLQKSKHNSLSYTRTPKNNIALFGVFKNGIPLQYGEIKKWATILEFDVVPLLYKGRVRANEVENLLSKLLETESYLGSVSIEGVVIKNYNKSLMLGGLYFPILCAKYVSEKFKEVHRTSWKRDNTSKGKFETFCESFRTEARWNKAVQHLKEEGTLLKEPKDIGNLIKEVARDIEEECGEDIKEFLFKEFGKQILRTSIKGLPEWYKNKLVSDMIRGDE
jgi:hypothetical protein